MRRTLVALCAALTLLAGGASSAEAFTNGNAPPGAVAPINTGIKCTPLQGQLTNPAAAGWNSMALAAGERLPTSGCDSAFRPYHRQVYWRNYWCGLGSCGNAAVPGTSNHGLAIAVDVPQFVRGYIDLHGKRFGYCKCWSDASHEWWHVLFNASAYGRPNPGTSLKYPVLRKGSGGPGQNVYVRKLQKLLRGHGDKTVRVNGEFDRTTAIAVRRFQRAQHLKINGIVSPRVWKRLRRPISKPVKTTPKHVPAGGTAAPPAHGKKHKPKKHRHKPPKKRKAKNRRAWGIDISSNNGCSINFKAVRHDGATFAITKATESTTYLNPCFGRKQTRAIGAAGLVPGTYHWLSPGGASGRAEAAYYANAIGRAGYGKGFLQPFVDVEERSSISSAAYCRELGEFVHTLKRVLGEKPIVYSTPSFVAEELGGSSCGYLNHYRLWIAHLGVKRPDVPAPFARWALWQYTWTAHVAGVPGEVDVSKVYGGTRALSRLRVRELPKRARLAPRAKVKLPLEAEPRKHLRNKVPAADKKPLPAVPSPEGRSTGLERR